jgi:hypothetical protein
MTVLISQLSIKPVLYTMGAANAVLLAACAYLALSQPDHSAALLGSPSHSSFSANIGTSAAGAGANSSTSSSQSDDPSSGPTAYAPSAPETRVVPTDATAVTQEQYRATDTPSQVQASSLNASRDKDGAGTPAVTGNNYQPAYNSTDAAAAAGGAATGAAFGVTTTSDPKNPAVTVPLAYTTPSDGATDRQAAVLNRLQSDFANTVNSQNQDTTSPAYTQAWENAQLQSDWSFKQQFGNAAFIQAQLAQARGIGQTAAQ